MEEISIKNKKIHYGWFITIGCALITFYTVGLAFNCISLYLNPLMEELDISNTLRSSMTMFYQGGSVVSLILVGKAIEKLGSRKCVLIFSILMALGYVVLSMAKQVAICYFAMLVIGIGYGLCGLVPVTCILTNWFEKKRGLAIGIAMSGSGIATLFAPKLITSLISDIGVKGAFVVQAVVITVCAVVACLILRNNPKDKNLLAYGKSTKEVNEDTDEVSKEASKETSSKVSFKEAIKDRNFIILSFILLIMGAMVSPMIQHLSPLVSQSGYSEKVAATVVSLYGVFMLLGKPLFGSVTDKFGITKANFCAFTFLLIALFDGVLLGRNDFQVYIIPFCLALGSAPMVTVGLPIWTAKLFGSESMASIFAMLKLVYTLGGMIGASIPGIVIDSTGSYTDLFKIYIAVALISFILLELLFKKQERREVK